MKHSSMNLELLNQVLETFHFSWSGLYLADVGGAEYVVTVFVAFWGGVQSTWASRVF